jgi:hypothetical protein
MDWILGAASEMLVQSSPASAAGSAYDFLPRYQPGQESP